MPAKTITHYRLWCGKKRYTPWLTSKSAVLRVALDKGLAFGDDRHVGLGPLTWIEYGNRTRLKARTITVKRSHVFGAHSWLA